MPKHLSQEFVDSDDDRSSPRADRKAKGKKPSKRQHTESEESEAVSSEDEKPLKKKAKKAAGKAESTSKGKGKAKEQSKKPIKERSESPQTKRTVGATAKYGSGPEVQTDGAGDTYVELAKNRRATVRDFKGKTYVDIRETYEKDGETLPGKKGIMLNIEQWDRLKKAIGVLDEAVDEKA
ncbi:hypothetical protein BMF94_6514 [Rhodotorula taiwanensis]|uniref:Transcriptional coactivator p15 (PC4) C-terminal domain-containing protein n=1 Tax=Rhodotorula taiwanensis TaxID=741276 RepID=A0A2S5B111_9BASI|nr:hypothetical protein BMF94_6514 [Rhodotorula taiwanensis]